MSEKIRYFVDEENREAIFTLDYFEDMINESRKRMTLLEMRRDYGSGIMWCRENQHETPIEKGDCGRDCPRYSPCNYIKGRCRYLDNCFIETGGRFILTEFGLKEDV